MSSFKFDADNGTLNFRLGNQDHTIGLFALNYVFHFPKDQEANIDFDRDESWGEITEQRNVPYQLRLAKEFKIHSPSLRYLHKVMSHSLFPIKEGDSIVTTIELNVLYCMVNNIKLDICHVLASKLKDIATKRIRAIKIGGLVLSIANYVGFDIENIPFGKLPSPSSIDLQMMEAMGMVEIGFMEEPRLIGVQQQARQEEEEEESDLQQVMSHLDTLEL